MQTVAPSAATGVAKPLKTQPVDKNKVWLLFGAGAAGIFTTAVLLENNERLFPAIAKANQAMRAAQQYREVSRIISAAAPVDSMHWLWHTLRLYPVHHPPTAPISPACHMANGLLPAALGWDSGLPAQYHSNSDSEQ